MQHPPSLPIAESATDSQGCMQMGSKHNIFATLQRTKNNALMHKKLQLGDLPDPYRALSLDPSGDFCPPDFLTSRASPQLEILNTPLIAHWYNELNNK